MRADFGWRQILGWFALILTASAPLAAQSPDPFPEYREEDLQKSDSGLRWKTLKEGDGEPLAAGETARVHYSGWLTDRTLFDSSRTRGQPFQVSVGKGQVIKGWDEGLVGMKVGEMRLLIISPELGYGDRGAGNVIPPGATLVFLVELVQIMKPPAFPAIDDTRIQETASGLAYVDLAEGEGEPPPAGSTVVVHYSGWLQSTKALFDSSRVRDEPFRFKIGKGQVIKGWDEGLSTMRRGARRILIIGPELGYGDRGAGKAIPPGATLVFDVELLEIHE